MSLPLSPEDGRATRVMRRVARWVRRGGISTLVFLIPTLVVFGLFSWWPIARGLVLAFQQTNLVTAAEWVGLDNFRKVLADPLLVTAARNTAWFALLALVFGYPAPLALAVFVRELRRGRALFSVLAYLPVVLPPVVAILLWRVFYDASDSGLFNTLARGIGLGPFKWLQDAQSAMPSIVLEATWANAGSTMIIYLAALSGVRTDLYEAAEIDGASIWRRIVHVTLPQMRTILLITLLLQIIGTFQVFTEPFLFTGGGPANATTTILMLLYNYAFINGDYGGATALSVLLAVFLGLLSLLYFRLTRRWSTT
ncbi:sugar ABC transporter permease [Nonomuraea sp. NPDC049625]|uniref:carbohydrate ABC transporter permease n=1 Tax=Nonomuraea sp. NPDC049625 TaxID=3155775 RepID=UPI003444C4C8